VKILFVTTNSYMPQSVGGMESSTHELCLEATKHGHKVTVLTGLSALGLFSFLMRIKMKLPYLGVLGSSNYCGYRVFRCWSNGIQSGIEDAVKQFRPSIAVVQSGEKCCVEKLLGLGIPTINYIRDSVRIMAGEGVAPEKGLSTVANSRYIASIYDSTFGCKAVVIPPLVRKELYQTSTERVTALFINPHPQKGVDTVLALAELNPEVEFVFVWCWSVEIKVIDYIEKRAAKAGNIRIYGPIRDMRRAYSRAKVLLVPTGTQFHGNKVELVEAWGRVVTEAHFCGIPVLATNDGGLPESVGPGGILVNKDAPIDDWNLEFKKLWYDKKLYAEIAQRAKKYSERPEISPEILFNRFFKVCEQSISGV